MCEAQDDENIKAAVVNKNANALQVVEGKERKGKESLVVTSKEKTKSNQAANFISNLQPKTEPLSTSGPRAGQRYPQSLCTLAAI